MATGTLAQNKGVVFDISKASPQYEHDDWNNVDNLVGYTMPAQPGVYDGTDNYFDVSGNYKYTYTQPGVKDTGGFFGGLGDVIKSILPVYAGFIAPELGSTLAATLGVSAEMGSAFANVALQVAQGKSFEDAVKSVAIDSIVKTGSDAFAKDLVAKSVDPKIANVVASAGGSAAKTAANGGSPEDILKNVEGAIAGSGTVGLTGSNVAGGVVSGGVTGGVGGAVLGGVGAIGAEQQKAENETKAKEAGFPDYATYSEYKGDANAYQTAKQQSIAEASGFPDYATYQKYGGDSVAYEADVNTKKATDAGFKDYKTYEQYGGDLQAFQTEQNNLIAKDAGFPDYATYQQFGGDATAYQSSVKEDTAKKAGFPDYATYEQYKGNINDYETAQEQVTAKNAGFPDYATYKQYGGDLQAYQTEINTKKATDAGFKDYQTYQEYDGDITKYNALQNDLMAKSAGFPDYATYQQYGGNVDAYKTSLNPITVTSPTAPGNVTIEQNPIVTGNVGTGNVTIDTGGANVLDNVVVTSNAVSNITGNADPILLGNTGTGILGTVSQNPILPSNVTIDTGGTNALNNVTVTANATGNVAENIDPILTGNTSTGILDTIRQNPISSGNVTIDTGGSTALNNVTVTANAVGNIGTSNTDSNVVITGGEVTTGNTGTTLNPVTVRAKKEPEGNVVITGGEVTTNNTGTALDPVTVRDKKEPEGNVVITSGTLDNVTIGTTGEDGIGNVTTGNATSNATTTSTYKPNLFILGGKQPKAPTSNAVLSQALGVSTGAAASRGAGEIEDPSTGKKRKNVWNEESLRLKDALGI